MSLIQSRETEVLETFGLAQPFTGSVDQPADLVERFKDFATAGPRPTFGEAFEAFYQEGVTSDQAFSRDSLLRDAYEPIVKALNDYRPARFPGDGFNNPFRGGFGGVIPRVTTEDEIWAAVEAARTDGSGTLANLPTREAFYAEALAPALEAIERAEDVRERSEGTLLAQLAGGAAAAFTDPLNLAAMPVGVTGGLMKTVLFEAAIGGGIEAVSLPAVSEFREELGHPMTADEAALRVGGGALAGGVFAGAFHGAGRLLQVAPDVRQVVSERIARLSRDEARAWFDRIFPNRENQDPDAQTLRLADDDEKALQADVGPDGDAGEAARTQDEIARALDAGEPVEVAGPILPDRVAVPGAPAPDSLGGVIHAFDPDTIEVDAATFQFKAGGDEFGVTERLQDVTEWDPVRAGLTVVYEYADGRRAIADGHQRLGLAKRLKARGQDVQLYSTVLRESDGITPGDARRIAAAKNIAEGTGTAVDAAKVLREAPGTDFNLPPRSALVTQAQGLMRLSDDAFGAVINDVIRPDHGALIGRLVSDESLHTAIVDVLARVKPENQLQAEAVIRQAVAAGATRETQESLFGEEVLVESLFFERAKVLDGAVRKLKRERSVMNTLVKDQATIEDTGSTVNVDNAAQRAQTDSAAVAMIQAVANRKGALSDALTQAAKDYKGGGKSSAIDGFVRAVRDAADRGDFTGDSAGRAIGDAQPETEGGARAQADLAEQQVSTQTLPDFDDLAARPDPADEQSDQLFALFDDVADGDEVTVPVELDDGTVADTSLTMKQIREEIEADEAAIDRLQGCVS